MTHYTTLGVSETATPEEIKKAYRKLASQHHPDKGGDTATFQKVEEAYRVLSDPQQRQRYDLERKGGNWNRFNFQDFGSDPDGVHININDIFSQFGFGFQQRPQRPHPRHNKDLRVEIPFTLEESLEDQQKTISVQTTNGTRETVTVNIPRGVSNGMSIKYPGLGDNFFNSLPRGDLYVNFRQVQDHRFQAIGKDLFTQIEISCLDAITGGETEIQGIDHRVFLLTIPPGTDHGTKFRVQGQGLYELHNPNRGHLIVETKLTVPKNLSPEQIDLIRQIQSSQ